VLVVGDPEGGSFYSIEVRLEVDSSIIEKLTYSTCVLTRRTTIHYYGGDRDDVSLAKDFPSTAKLSLFTSGQMATGFPATGSEKIEESGCPNSRSPSVRQITGLSLGSYNMVFPIADQAVSAPIKYRLPDSAVRSIEVTQPDATVTADLRWVPGECRPEKITYADFNGGLDTIIAQSQLMDSLLTKLNGKFKVSRTSPPVSPDTALGLTTPDRTIEPVYDGIGSRFEAATAMLAHELTHVKQFSDRYAPQRAAPYLSESQYLALLWQDEAEAFDFVAAVLDQIKASSPVWANCVDSYRDQHPDLRTMTPDKRAEQIVDTYSLDSQRKAYDRLHNGPKDPAIGQRVAQDSGYLQSIEQRWRVFLAPPP
jgi:hypothetical protein